MDTWQRRVWSVSEKKQLVAETLEPGVTVTSVVRKADVHENLLYKRRQDHRNHTSEQLAPVAITFPDQGSVTPRQIEIASRDYTICIGGDIDQEVLRLKVYNYVPSFPLPPFQMGTCVHQVH